MNEALRQRGVTLIELLVVLAILALMAGAVAFNLPPARDNAKNEAERFAALLNAASSETIVDGRPLRLQISQSSYSFARFEGGEWRPVDPATNLAEHKLDGVAIDVVLEDPAMRNEKKAAEGAEQEVRRILLDPIGATSPFTADFTSRRERWRVSRESDGAIKVIENARP